MLRLSLPALSRAGRTFPICFSACNWFLYEQIMPKTINKIRRLGLPPQSSTESQEQTERNSSTSTKFPSCITVTRPVWPRPIRSSNAILLYCKTLRQITDGILVNLCLEITKRHCFKFRRLDLYLVVNHFRPFFTWEELGLIAGMREIEERAWCAFARN